MKNPHTPVLINQILKFIDPKNDAIYVDATFGAGGYSKAFLEAANCKVFAIDRDPNIKSYAEKLSAQFKDKFDFIQGEFANIDSLLASHGVYKVDGIAFDIGVSSMQLDQAERGFSFLNDGPLDMRMDPKQSLSAEYLVNELNEQELAYLIFHYGGERKSKIIARAIIKSRQEKRITTTLMLAELIKTTLGYYKDTIHPATRTFQALRIKVNNELEQLEKGIKAAANILKLNATLAVVTFHSLEDKIVKNYFNDLTGKSINVNRYFPDFAKKAENNNKCFQYIVKKAIKPEICEIKSNKRARSAKLRVIKRISS